MTTLALPAASGPDDSPRALPHGLRALAYTGVAGIGFAVDAIVLSLCLHLGMPPAWARVVSLTCAMQATFWINGLFVFRCLRRDGWVSAWAGYMLTNGFGNFCNYWVFLTLVSLHRPVVSDRWLDLAIGGITAWIINYSCAHFLVFGRVEGEANCTPAQAVIRRFKRRLYGRRANA